MKKESKQLMFINIGFFFLFLIDRVLKWWAFNHLSEISPIKFIRIFLLELYLNEGIIFSFPLPKIIIYSLTSLVISGGIYFLYRYYQRGDRRKQVAVSLIIIGAFSNLLDRIRYGAIIDFVDLRVLPVFNLADCLIITGIIILILKLSNVKEYNNEKVH